MRHILTFIASVTLLTALSSILPSGCGHCTSRESDSDTLACDDESSLGETLWQTGKSTYIFKNLAESDIDWFSLREGRIVVYSGQLPVDSCHVAGYNRYYADGPLLKLTIGIDTVTYDLRSLPDTIFPLRKMFPFRIREHKFARTFELADSSWDCEFRFSALLPENHPAWLDQLISTIMRNDMQALYLDNKGSDRLIKEYCGIEAHPRKVRGINAASMSLEEIARHFASEHEKLYRREFPVDEYDGHGPKYDYSIEITPAWFSSDSALATYRFSTYYYTMGMHGYMEEYYLTFDNHTGRLLGYRDIIGADRLDPVLENLGGKIAAHKEESGYDIDSVAVYIDNEELSSNAVTLIKEVYGGHYYPRPAITQQGVVFTYQPYEKGGFWEGVIHFLIPHNEIHVKPEL